MAKPLSPNRIVERIGEALDRGKVVTCRECSTELPDDTKCEYSDDGHHDPDQVIWEPAADEPQTRQIPVAFTLTVPNDGYDYATDVTGRLEHLLTLMLLHPLVSRAETGGPTGSGLSEEAA